MTAAAQLIDALHLPRDPKTLAATLEPIWARCENCGAWLTKIETRAIHRRTIRQFWFELALGIRMKALWNQHLRVGAPTPPSWNQIASWLKQIDNLRQAA